MTASASNPLGQPESVAGILLTGGTSRRMGRDKATIRLADNVTLAERLGRLLSTVVSPAIEIGPGVSGLRTFQDDHPGQGPLAAIATGQRRLEELGHRGAVVVLSCDLALLGLPLLRLIAEWPGPASVVPVAGGRDQPLCGRFSGEALRRAAELIEDGHHSLQALLERIPVRRLSEAEWQLVADPEELADVDTPEDLAALGIVLG